MFLTTFQSTDGLAVGAAQSGSDSDTLIDLSWSGFDLEPQWRCDLATMLRDGKRASDAVGRAIAQADRRAIRLVSGLKLLAPIPHPGKIVGVGLNYRDHAEETGQAIPTTPVVFAKFPTAAAGPFDSIVYPAISHRLDYEGELGVVIGSSVRECSVQEAPSAVGGYVALNDVSARDVQNQTSQWVLGKSFDGFAPMGPWLATPDEVGDPHDLDITVRVNGDLRQSSNTHNLIFGVYELISYLSQVCTLEPGDVIATGTPGGVGIGFKPERLLSIGDRVDVEIERIGCISSSIVSPTAAQ